jgi:hypothetical protein
MGTIVRHPLLGNRHSRPPEEDPVDAAGAAAEVRRAAAVVREAQAVRRRLEKLAATAPDIVPSSKLLLDEALVCVQRLADDLAHHQRSQQRRLDGGLRRRR